MKLIKILEALVTEAGRDWAELQSKLSNKRYAPLSQDEETSLRKAFLTADAPTQAKIKTILVDKNSRLVKDKAWKMSRATGLDPMELYGAGLLGIAEAFENFDWERGFRFSTYADSWISAMMKDIMYKANPVKVPRGDQNAYFKAKRDARKSGEDVESLYKTMDLDKPREEGESSFDVASPEDMEAEYAMMDKLKAIIDAMPHNPKFKERTKHIVFHSLGLGKYPEMTSQELGKIHGLGVTPIDNIKRWAMGEIRKIYLKNNKGKI